MGAAATGRSASVAMSVHLGRVVLVLGEERLLEARLATDEVDDLVTGRDRHDRSDGPRDAHPKGLILRDEIAHTRQRRELAERYLAREDKLHLVVREVAQVLDAADSRQAALADDGHAVARALDLREDVARQKDGPALGLGLADDGIERLLDERVEARRRLIEDQQLRPVLERDHEPDLLLVA